LSASLGSTRSPPASFLSRGLRDAPNIIDNVIVPHRGDLLLPLGGQQTQPHDAAERPDILGRGSLPDRSDLVIENAIARFGIAAFHASGENRDVVRPVHLVNRRGEIGRLQGRQDGGRSPRRQATAPPRRSRRSAICGTNVAVACGIHFQAVSTRCAPAPSTHITEAILKS
jgi:hypothetical protein